MNTKLLPSNHRAISAWLLVLLLQAGCSKLSDVGKQPQAVPQAKASTLGLAYTRDNDGNITTTVRSGSDVVLSGKDSLKSPDDSGLPILYFKWEQSASDTAKARVIDRTSNTVSFTAPDVTQDTTLHFTLTVTNAKGTTASTTAQILVKPIRDSDHFLQYLRADNSFPVSLVTQNAIAANSAALPFDSLPVTVTVTKLVSFTDRGGTPHVQVPVGSPVVVNASWSALVGTSTDCNAIQNPKMSLPIPRVNTDDLLGAAISGYPQAVTLSDVMEASDVDSLTLEVKLDLTSANSLVTTAIPNVCINGTTTPSASGTILARETLFAANAPRDSRASAVAYFAAIDPTNAKDTMDKWLDANGFDSKVSGWKADAHAIYTNNFDLGFGRNMYMKFGACDTGFAQLPLDQRVGHCDVAAIVLNYVDLEAAAKLLNPIMAVAMEYSASPGTGARYTKFYTFAPDTRTGGYKRVLSVNLDRRGEEYMPQTCVVCHGGTPGTAASYATSADISATFIGWDLDSFLYSDTDPGFSSKSSNAALKAQFTRGAQMADFKKFNDGAYLTYADPVSTPGRYALARELVEKWHGGVGLPTVTYDDSTVPAGWQPGGASNNPADSDKIYKEVFARNCRGCHVLQVTAAGDPRTATITPQGQTTPIAACSNNVLLANTSVGAASQVPMGCYWEFAHAPNLATDIGSGQMPFARRTMDQMWTANTGSQSSGQKLQSHMLNTQDVTVLTPGTATACIDTFGTPIPGQSGVAVLRNTWVALGSSCSRYLTGPIWVLKAPTGSKAALIGTDTGVPRFRPDLQGNYTVTLADKSGAPAAIVVARVLSAAPTAGSGARDVVIDSTGNASIDVDVMQLAGSQSRDPISGLTIVGTTRATASVQSISATSAVVHIDTSSLNGGTVQFQLVDIDGDVSGVGTITINVSASIVANDATISVNTNGSAPINLSNLVSAAGQPFTLTIQSAPVVNRGRGAGSLTAPTSGTVTYTAPLGVTSHIGNSLISAASIDSFVYQACFVTQPSVCDTGTVTVNLIGSRPFNEVVLQMGLNCSECHFTTPPVSGLVGDANPNYIVQKLTDTTTLAPYDTVPARKAYYCLFKTNSPLNESTVGVTYIDTTNPAASLLFRKPQGLDGHKGGTRFSDPSIPPLSTIYEWINEGAYFTESTNQGCP